MIPCKECLMIPICRHKKYGDMLIKCRPLYEYLYRSNPINSDDLRVEFRQGYFEKEIIKVHNILSSTMWEPGTFEHVRTDTKVRIKHRSGRKFY